MQKIYIENNMANIYTNTVNKLEEGQYKDCTFRIFIA